MPTRPNPDSPFMDSRVEAAFGLRGAGTPSSAGKPGVQPADVSFPAAPGVATAPPGRPAAPTVPQPAGVTPPAAPGAPAPAPAAKPKAEGTPSEPAAPALPTAPGAAAVPPSSSAATPLGVTSRDPLGNVTTALSPEGGQRYREVAVQLRASLGPIPRVFRDPNLPEMPVEVGQWNYNPFTGQWGGR
jgi:hypothetical protein